jgi:hypothetical protein
MKAERIVICFFRTAVVAGIFHFSPQKSPVKLMTGHGSRGTLVA